MCSILECLEEVWQFMELGHSNISMDRLHYLSNFSRLATRSINRMTPFMQRRLSCPSLESVFLKDKMGFLFCSGFLLSNWNCLFMYFLFLPRIHILCYISDKIILSRFWNVSFDQSDQLKKKTSTVVSDSNLYAENGNFQVTSSFSRRAHI